MEALIAAIYLDSNIIFHATASNIFLGQSIATNLTTGTVNVIIGRQAAENLTSANFSVIIPIV